MSHDELTFFKIEDYLDGKLSPAEAAAFERAIAADAALAEAVELHRFEREGMEFQLETSLRAKLKTWKNQPPTDDWPPVLPSKSTSYGRFWRWLLPVCLLIGAAGLYFFQQKTAAELPASPVEQPAPKSPDSLIPQRPVAENEPKINPSRPQKPAIGSDKKALALAAYRQPDELLSQIRSTDVAAESADLTAAIAAFERQPADFAAAIQALQKISSQSVEFEAAQELLAHAFFQAGRFAEAAFLFEKKAREARTASVKDEAEWYRMLSLLPDYERQQLAVERLLKKMRDAANRHAFREDALRLPFD